MNSIRILACFACSDTSTRRPHRHTPSRQHSHQANRSLLPWTPLSVSSDSACSSEFTRAKYPPESLGVGYVYIQIFTMYHRYLLAVSHASCTQAPGGHHCVVGGNARGKCENVSRHIDLEDHGQIAELNRVLLRHRHLRVYSFTKSHALISCYRDW